MKALIFGINGQDGHYLSELLQNKKHKRYGSLSFLWHITGDVADYSFSE